MTYSDSTNIQIVWMIVVSIIIAGLIIRIVFTILDAVNKLVDDALDEEHRNGYKRSKYYWLNAVLVAFLCLFIVILLYEGYVVEYIKP